MAKPTEYLAFVGELKSQILHSRYQAARLVNREMLLLYFAVGKRLSEKVAAQKWGAKVIEQLSHDLQRELPGLRGFSYRNMRNMRQFAEAYPQFWQPENSQSIGNQSVVIWQLATAKLNKDPIGQLSTAQLDKAPIGQTVSAQLAELDPEVFLSLGFTSHVLLLNRCKNWEERKFYMELSVNQQWSVEILDHQIAASLFQKQGALPNNFTTTLPENLRDQALLAFKDEYLLDFINIDPEDERVLEKNIVENIRRFILTMGKGFAFMGNQYRVVVDGDEFFIDLLFYNRLLQCLVAVELKHGKFRPEHAGKSNFYLNVLNELVRLPHENPSIGIVLCKEKSDPLVQFAVRNIENPIGVATYRLDPAVPDALREVLPDVEGLRRLLCEK